MDKLIIPLIISIFILTCLLYYRPDNNQRYILSSLYFLWGKTKYVLDKHDIHYFACGGSLLGARRDGGIIQHDDDIDIGVMEDEMHKLKSDSFNRDLERENLYIKHGDITKIYSKDLKHGFFVDVFSFTESDKIITLTSESNREMWPDEYFYSREMFPVVEYKFGNLTIMGPHNPVPYFERFYGKDWMIPKKEHDHLGEIGL